MPFYDLKMFCWSFGVLLKVENRPLSVQLLSVRREHAALVVYWLLNSINPMNY